MEYLGDESKAHFETLLAGLDGAGVAYVANPRPGAWASTTTLAPCSSVVTTRLGAQGTVCAGGRFDGLVEQLGGRRVPAVGFAMGLERLIALLEETDLAERPARHRPLSGDGGGAGARRGRACCWQERLRDQLPKLRLIAHCGGGSFKSQFKKADKSNARYALILGDDELAPGRGRPQAHARSRVSSSRWHLERLSEVITDVFELNTK